MITMKKLIILIMLILCASFVNAHTDFMDDLEGIRRNYNENFNAPSYAQTLFGDQRINIYITAEDGDEFTVGAINENSKINNLEPRGIEDPTMNVYVDEATIEEILTSTSPFDALSNAMNSGALRYEAITTGNKIKLGFASVVIKFISWFR